MKTPIEDQQRNEYLTKAVENTSQRYADELDAEIAKEQAVNYKEFTPNGGVYKEYPQACNGVRQICALHTFTDGDVWLVFFNTGNGKWEKVRDATQEDKNFFKWNPFPTTIREVAFSEDKDIPEYSPVREDEVANESRSA